GGGGGAEEGGGPPGGGGGGGGGRRGWAQVKRPGGAGPPRHASPNLAPARRVAKSRPKAPGKGESQTEAGLPLRTPSRADAEGRCLSTGGGPRAASGRPSPQVIQPGGGAPTRHASA